MNKYTKEELVTAVDIELMCTDIKLTKKQLKKVLDSYENVIYKILLGGEPICFGNVGTFKFKTTAPRKEMFNILLQKNTPPIPPYSKVKFQVNKNLAKAIKEKTLNNPFDTKTSM